MRSDMAGGKGLTTFGLTLATVLIAINSFATTYYSTGNGAWGGSVWNAGDTNGVGSTLPALQAGDILVIDDQITIASTTITITPTITINITTTSATAAKLIFKTGGKLALTSASSVINLSRTSAAFPLPMIDGSGAGASNTIRIGGNTVWQASDGDVSGIGQLNSGSSTGALPIKLLYFNAHYSDGNVELKWATASEENFDKFVIERSADGKSFTSLAEVKGAGDSKDILNYAFNDPSPLYGNAYYRLKSIDLDKSFDYSKVVYLTSDTNTDHKIWISPNPSNGDVVHFNMDFDESALDRVFLLNNFGKEITNDNAARLNGKFVFDSKLSPGVYFIKYVTTDSVLVTRFVVN